MPRCPDPKAPALPGVPLGAPRDEGLAPILSLDAARHRRRRPGGGEAVTEDASEGGAGRDARQREVLTAAVSSGRLGSADLFAMVRLGILTDDVALLPCADRHRAHNALDWERRYLEATGAPGADHPSASQVGCPLMARAASAEAPACVEALRHRAQIPVWRPEDGFTRHPLDADDPVVAADLRPCVLLGREIFRHLLRPLGQDEPG